MMTLGREYLLSTQELDIYGTASAYAGPVLILHGTRDSIVPLWPSGNILWLALGTVATLIVFNRMFSFFVKKYTSRILGFREEKKSLLAFLPVKGWIMVTFFMCLGIALKHIPGVPTEFFASFYCGLGPALIVAGVTAPTGVNAAGDTGWNGNNYSSADWTKMESAGCVFLPAAGSRGYESVWDLGEFGHYWSATLVDTEGAYNVFFNSGNLSPATYESRYYGFSVRLVQEVTE